MPKNPIFLIIVVGIKYIGTDCVNPSVAAFATAALVGNGLFWAKIDHLNKKIIHNSVKTYDILMK